SPEQREDALAAPPAPYARRHGPEPDSSASPAPSVTAWPSCLPDPCPIPRTPGHFETHLHVTDSGAEPPPRAGPIPPLHVERQRWHDGERGSRLGRGPVRRQV